MFLGRDVNRDVQTSFAAQVSAQLRRRRIHKFAYRVTGMPDLAQRCATATG